jgi:hypothetical protein
VGRSFVVRSVRDGENQGLGRAGSERGERIAQRLCPRPVMGVAAVEMDELPELVDVLDRML